MIKPGIRVGIKVRARVTSMLVHQITVHYNVKYDPFRTGTVQQVK